MFKFFKIFEIPPTQTELNEKLLKTVGDANPNGKKIQSLLHYGADIKAKNKDRDTALTLAVSYAGRKDIVRLLLHRGADIEAKNKAGNTAMILAKKQEDVDATKMLVTFNKTINQYMSRYDIDFKLARTLMIPGVMRWLLEGEKITRESGLNKESTFSAVAPDVYWLITSSLLNTSYQESERIFKEVHDKHHLSMISNCYTLFVNDKDIKTLNENMKLIEFRHEERTRVLGNKKQ